ncbi:MAG: hypothetical protein AAFQ83_19150 [Bacteroidota bacterium]
MNVFDGQTSQDQPLHQGLQTIHRHRLTLRTESFPINPFDKLKLGLCLRLLSSGQREFEQLDFLRCVVGWLDQGLQAGDCKSRFF